MRAKKKLYALSHNNSGGSWWLKDKDWRALAKAGWKVEWFNDHKSKMIFRPDKKGRWLGALAGRAAKKFACIRDAVEEFERITKQDFFERGCGCCGAPFSMSCANPYEYISGDSVEREVRRPW